MEFLGIAAISIAGTLGWFVIFELPDILKKRSENLLEAEKERTKQKELELETAKVAAQPRRTGPIDI
jgi:hypothetical protein